MERAAGSAGLLLTLALFAACVEGGQDTALDEQAAEVLANAEVVVNDQLAEVVVALDALDIALEALQASPSDPALRAHAQRTWADVFTEWQHIEPMQLGALGSSLSVVGGADVRDEVYSWPSVNPCRVDQETLEAEWDQPSFFTANLVNSYGLDALEQVLFGQDEDTCVAQVGIDQDWDALGPDGVALNRAAFAQALSAGIRAHVEQPVTLEFSDTQQGLDEILRALFYLDTVTKDLKVARPAGITGCGTETCPEEAEARTSGASSLAVLANLEGFRLLFTGDQGMGLDDLLVAVGHEDLVDAILEALDEAEAAVLDQPLDQAVTSDLAAVEALHAAIKAVTDLLKGDVTTALSLQIPTEAAGDAD